MLDTKFNCFLLVKADWSRGKQGRLVTLGHEKQFHCFDQSCSILCLFFVLTRKQSFILKVSRSMLTNDIEIVVYLVRYRSGIGLLSVASLQLL